MGSGELVVCSLAVRDSGWIGQVLLMGNEIWQWMGSI
jgi:hypothetical protein